LTFGLYSLVFSQVVSAQEEIVPMATLRFIAVTAVEGSVGWKEGKVFHPIPLDLGMFNIVKMPRIGAVLKLYSETKDVQGHAVYTDYASAPWPTADGDAVALVSARGTAGNLVLYSDSKQIHPEHSMRVINGCGVTLALKLGGANSILPQWGSSIEPYDPGKEILPFGLAVQSEQEGWRLICSSNLAPLRNHRIFLVLRALSRREMLERNLDPNGPFIPEFAFVYDRTTETPPPPPLPLPPQ
jgi:hypothetical protein